MLHSSALTDSDQQYKVTCTAVASDYTVDDQIRVSSICYRIWQQSPGCVSWKPKPASYPPSSAAPPTTGFMNTTYLWYSQKCHECNHRAAGKPSVSLPNKRPPQQRCRSSVVRKQGFFAAFPSHRVGRNGRWRFLSISKWFLLSPSLFHILVVLRLSSLSQGMRLSISAAICPAMRGGLNTSCSLCWPPLDTKPNALKLKHEHPCYLCVSKYDKTHAHMHQK